MLHCNVVSYILLTLACFQNYDINIRNGYIRNHFGKRKPHAKHSLHFCRRYATSNCALLFLIAKSVGSRSLTLVCYGWWSSKLTNFSYIAIFYPFTLRTLVTLVTLETLGTLGTLRTLGTLGTLRTLRTLGTLRTLRTLGTLRQDQIGSDKIRQDQIRSNRIRQDQTGSGKIRQV